MSRFQAAVAAACLIIAASLAWVYLSIDQSPTDPLASRKRSQQVLSTLSGIIQSYRSAHEGAWPKTYKEIFVWDKNSENRQLKFGFNAVRGGGVYVYQAPPADGIDAGTAIMASNKAHPEIVEDGKVVAAEAYYILTSDFQVEEVNAEEHRAAAQWIYVEEGQK